MRMILALLLWLGADPAAAGCFVFCDETVLTGPAAAEALAADLGQPLPAGVTVTHLLQGGFQDPFIQVRIEADAAGTADLLRLLGSGADLLSPGATDASYGAASAPWWTPAAEPGLRQGEARLGSYAHCWVGVAPAKAGAHLYIFAFRT